VILGFTGTQQELPPAQARGLGFLLGGIKNAMGVVEVHHGDCVGADAAFDRLCATLDFPRHAHPGPDTKKRAHCEADVIYEEQPFLDRNRVIVDACDLLIACPRGPETRRSGTWSTVRYARKEARRIVFVWPDGTVTEEGS
jgi:hypothetical protein